MKFINTNGPETCSFEEAIFSGEAPNGGPWMPECIPKLTNVQIRAMRNMSYEEIAFVVLKPYLENEIPDDDLKQILHACYSGSIMSIGLKQVNDRHILGLSNGPTLAFKDWGMRFFFAVMNYFLQKRRRKRELSAPPLATPAELPQRLASAMTISLSS